MYSKVLFTAACLLAMVNGIKLDQSDEPDYDSFTEVIPEKEVLDGMVGPEYFFGHLDDPSMEGDEQSKEEGSCGCGCDGGCGCGCGKEEEPKPCEDTIIEEYSDSVGALEAADRLAKEQVD